MNIHLPSDIEGKMIRKLPLNIEWNTSFNFSLHIGLLNITNKYTNKK
jgi:hypothetical protein